MRHFFFVLVVFSRPSLQYRCPCTRSRGLILAKALPKWGFPRLFFVGRPHPLGIRKCRSWGVSKCCLVVARHDILAWIHFQRLFAFFHWRCCTATKSFSLTLSCSRLPSHLFKPEALFAPRFPIFLASSANLPPLECIAG